MAIVAVWWECGSAGVCGVIEDDALVATQPTTYCVISSFDTANWDLLLEWIQPLSLHGCPGVSVGSSGTASRASTGSPPTIPICRESSRMTAWLCKVAPVLAGSCICCKAAISGFTACMLVHSADLAPSADVCVSHSNWGRTANEPCAVFRSNARYIRAATCPSKSCFFLALVKARSAIAICCNWSTASGGLKRKRGDELEDIPHLAHFLGLERRLMVQGGRR